MNPLLVVNTLNKTEEEIKNFSKTYSAWCVIFDENDNVVMVSFDYEGKKFGRMYAIAGGHIEEGETPEIACKREILEEAGFVVSEVGPIGSITLVREDRVSVSYGFVAHVKAKQQQELQITQEEKDENHTTEILSFDDAVSLLNRQYIKTRQGATLRNLTFLLEAKHLLDIKKKTT